MKTNKNGNVKTTKANGAPPTWQVVATILHNGKPVKQYEGAGWMERGDNPDANYIHNSINNGEKGAEVYVKFSVRKDIVGLELPKPKKAQTKANAKFVPIMLK